MSVSHALTVASREWAEQWAEQVLAVAGPGSVLEVGVGASVLVPVLLARGVRAVGFDVGGLATDRTAPGGLTLPSADGAFATVVCAGVLERLEEADVDRAVGEMVRAAERYLLVRVPNGDASGGRSAHGRAWWESRFFAAGLRKHPLAQSVTPFGALESEGPFLTIVLEKIPGGAAERYPLESLRAGRDLHMDMLRESGRRSDAHIARYTLAAGFVRPGDAVLDAACGLGYGSAILAAGSGARSVLGIDADAHAVEYSTANFARPGHEGAGTVEFRRGDATDLSFLPDRSIDVAVSFETLEHLADPRKFLAELQRVLTPGGRIVASVPNDWTDETGRDPNAHHLQVYTWDRLAGEISERFLLEKAYRQTAGGGMKLGDRGRLLEEVAFDGAPGTPQRMNAGVEAEWWVLAAMKSPIGADKAGYRENAFPEYHDLPDYNVTAFARDYDNPWLFRSIADTGVRMSNQPALEYLCREVIRTARPGSPDHGSALCVLAYATLTRGSAEEYGALVGAIERYADCADDTPHGVRWRISGLHVAARLLLAMGDRARARAMFLRCAGEDYSKFSPLLASKIIESLHQAGLLAAGDGDTATARALWTRGIEEARRALSGDWVNIWGRPGAPLPWGLHDAAVVADHASRCAACLGESGKWADRPAQAWSAAQRQTFGDSRQWIQKLLAAKRWLEHQVADTRALADKYHTEVLELRAWVEQHEQGKAWLEQLRATSIAAAESRRRSPAGVREYITGLESGNRWLAEQAAAWQSAVAEREKLIGDLKSWNATLEGAKDFFREQRDALEASLAERERIIADLRAWNKELESASAWHNEQARAWEANTKERGAEIERLHAWAADLQRTVEFHRQKAEEQAKFRDYFEQESLRWRSLAEGRERTILELKTGMRAGERPADAASPRRSA